MAKDKEPNPTIAPEASVPSISTRILTAKTRGELVQQIEELKTSIISNSDGSPSGNVFIAGPVARSKDDGTYSIQVNIVLTSKAE